jgi:hypothetical protein
LRRERRKDSLGILYPFAIPGVPIIWRNSFFYKISCNHSLSTSNVRETSFGSPPSKAVLHRWLLSFCRRHVLHLFDEFLRFVNRVLYHAAEVFGAGIKETEMDTKGQPR